MKPFNERAADAVCGSQIAVYVLLSQENDSLEFIQIKPRLEEFISGPEFTARKLRIVGAVALHGLAARAAFNEPLEPPVVDAIRAAFIQYTRVLLGDSIAEQAVVAEIAELERIYVLPDTRSYPHPRFQA